LFGHPTRRLGGLLFRALDAHDELRLPIVQPSLFGLAQLEILGPETWRDAFHLELDRLDERSPAAGKAQRRKWLQVRKYGQLPELALELANPLKNLLRRRRREQPLDRPRSRIELRDEPLKPLQLVSEVPNPGIRSGIAQSVDRLRDVLKLFREE